ncbi:MAG: hypothetical protein A2Y97_01425 [Nitrospirae bacterium RBG_13_39_12]|nr:MAG: hypothetical protein A2Y97_01425 [Nitrospirae bacterium RBG_13_39_12]
MQDVISDYLGEGNNLKKDIKVSSRAENRQQKTQLTDYSSVLKNNPFGFTGGEIKSLNTTSKDSGARQTDIALIGTVVGPRELSYGIFEDTAGTQEVFKVGESVLGVGVLYRVKKDRVLVRQKDEILEIILEDVEVREIKKPVSGGTSFTSSFARKIGNSTYLVDQRKVQEAISNPNQIMTDARLKPNLNNGREEGFVLSEVKPGGIYNSLGLREGDILLRINEYDISEPEKALQAFTALKGLERVQIDLIRGGSKMTMTYQIK